MDDMIQLYFACFEAEMELINQFLLKVGKGNKDFDAKKIIQDL